jgi:hypothetical protein
VIPRPEPSKQGNARSIMQHQAASESPGLETLMVAVWVAGSKSSDREAGNTWTHCHVAVFVAMVRIRQTCWANTEGQHASFSWESRHTNHGPSASKLIIHVFHMVPLDATSHLVRCYISNCITESHWKFTRQPSWPITIGQHLLRDVATWVCAFLLGKAALRGSRNGYERISAH